MSKFYKITVSKVDKLTPDSVVITFDIPNKYIAAFAYKAGQHVIVRSMINGEDVRRTYSFCSAPGAADFRISVRHVKGGVFSAYANTKLKAGDTLELSQPLGTFTLIPKQAPKSGAVYVGIAAGSGITPILSMIRAALTANNNSRFFLYYGNRDVEHTMFFKELAALKNQYMHRLSVQLFLTRQSVDDPFWGGRIDTDKITHLHKNVFGSLGVDGYFLCGPKAMIDGARQSLIAAGEPEANIHSELFFADGTASRGTETAQTSQTPLAALAKAKINIIMDGREVQVEYREEHGSILEAALSAGLDVSFSCKGGVCATCRAKVTKGEVEMGLNYGLEPEEIDEGFVLSCQSVPLSDDVTISYDE